jgi:hypothetical protein
MSDTPLMETQSGRPEPTPLRASDAERERVAAMVREGAAEGRITLEELSERLELAYAARTRPDLEAVVEDLPGRDAIPRETGRPRAARWTVAVIGNEERGGRWRPGDDTRALALIGDCTLDLRQAEVDGGALTVTAIAVLGDVRVVVPPGVAVELEGVALVGDKKYRVSEAPELPTGAPQLRVTAYAVVGDVTVMSEPPVSRRDHLRAALAHLRGPGDRGPSPPAEDADRPA